MVAIFSLVSSFTFDDLQLNFWQWFYRGRKCWQWWCKEQFMHQFSKRVFLFYRIESKWKRNAYFTIFLFSSVVFFSKFENSILFCFVLQVLSLLCAFFSLSLYLFLVLSQIFFLFFFPISTAKSDCKWICYILSLIFAWFAEPPRVAITIYMTFERIKGKWIVYIFINLSF